MMKLQKWSACVRTVVEKVEHNDYQDHYFTKTHVVLSFTEAHARKRILRKANKEKWGPNFRTSILSIRPLTKTLRRRKVIA